MLLNSAHGLLICHSIEKFASCSNCVPLLWWNWFWIVLWSLTILRYLNITANTFVFLSYKKIIHWGFMYKCYWIIKISFCLLHRNVPQYYMNRIEWVKWKDKHEIFSMRSMILRRTNINVFILAKYKRRGWRD